MAKLGVAAGGAVVGGVIGSFVGMPMLGAQIGWAVGGIAGALLFPDGKNTEGPRLNDLAVQTSGFGVPIPVVAARAKLSGNVIWKMDLEERKTTRRQGKGGGPKYTEYSYYLSFAVGLCEWLIPPTNPNVLRIWLDNKLVHDSTGQSELVAIPGMVWRFCNGHEEQLPDPLLEAKLGEDAPAFRGLAYIVFEDLPLDKFGNRMPNVTVELASEVTRTFPQVNSVPPAAPLFASNPGGPSYLSEWSVNVAIDHHRGRIYEARTRASGRVGGADDELIRVYDLVTMETIGEYSMADMVEPLVPLGMTTRQVAISGAHMHLAANGYLYCCGGPNNKYALWKIDPDTWRAVDVFGPVGGGGLGFGDNGTSIVMPMGITSFQVPMLMAPPRTFIVVQGAWSAMNVIDGDSMIFVWGAGDLSTSPPVIPTNLSISPLTYPIAIVPGRMRDDGFTDVWYLRGSEGSPYRVDVVRFRFGSAAAYLGGGVSLGIERFDSTPIDVQAEVDALNTRPLIQAAWWDETDDALVITISGGGSPLATWTRFSTFKWAPGSGVVWKVVDHAAPAQHDARGAMGRVLGGVWGMAGNFVTQPGTGDVQVNESGNDFNSLFWLSEQEAVIGYRSSGPGAKEIAKRYLTRAAADTLTVGQVTSALCTSAGMQVSDIDVSELTDPIRGYTLARPMPRRDAITTLAAAWQFDAAEIDDRLVFRKRGGAVGATITYDDLVREDPDSSVIEEQRAQDQDLPREITVRFSDIDRGWEQNAQSWRRPLSPTATVATRGSTAMDLPIPLNADEGKTIARRMCIATWRERTKLSVTVGPKFARLVPTDVVYIGARDGALIRSRILSVQDGANWTRRIEAVTEDSAVYALTATADGGGYWDEPQLPLPYYTRQILPDLALVGDNDDTGQTGLREYLFACAYHGARWRGVRAVRSADLTTWSDVATVTTPTAWGSVAELPAAPATPWTWDEVGELVVRMTDGEPESATALEVLNWANLAALVGPDGTAEIIQFRDAVDEGGGVFRLTGLLRGRRGTEDQIATRAAGDLFVLLDGSRAAFQAQVTEANATRFHRAVSVFESIATSAPTVTKSRRGRAEKPYAVAHLAGTRDLSGNLTLTWIRRTRIGGEWLDGTGTVPVSEGAEAYEVDIMDGPLPLPGIQYSAPTGTPANAFDGQNNTLWGGGPLPISLEVDFGEPRRIQAYGVRTENGYPLSAAPKAWTVDGWDAVAGAWVTIDSRSGETGWGLSELRTYATATPGTYARYRFRVTEAQGANSLTISQFSLYPWVGGPDIAAAAYARSAVRTLTSSSPTVTYTATQQVSDFGAAQAEVYVEVYQMSNIVGRGIAAEATV